MPTRTWRPEDSCYLRQGGGQNVQCSVPGCDRHDDEGTVKKMMGDDHVGSLYCPYHWYMECWQQYQQRCPCHGCQVVALKAAAELVSLAPDLPVPVLSCTSVLQAASQAPVANKLIVEHGVQCTVIYMLYTCQGQAIVYTVYMYILYIISISIRICIRIFRRPATGISLAENSPY